MYNLLQVCKKNDQNQFTQFRVNEDTAESMVFLNNAIFINIKVKIMNITFVKINIPTVGKKHISIIGITSYSIHSIFDPD